MTDPDPIPVGVAEYGVSTGERPLRTSGVGSCVVVVLHDEDASVSGLLHFMLPTADRPAEAAKFADTGTAALVSALQAHGGTLSRTWAKLAGGAALVGFESLGRPVGERNVEAAKQELRAHGIPIQAADVGGDVGRTVTFEPSTKELRIQTAGGDEYRL